MKTRKLSRLEQRMSDRNGAKQQAKPWSEFREVTYSTPGFRENGGHSFDRIWQNTQYIVFLLRDAREHMGARWDRVMCRRNDSKPILSWSDMQRIKNELFGPEVEAIQFLPRESELTDVANLYWFFVPKGTSYKCNS